MNKTIIRAEANFIQESLYECYSNRRLISDVLWKSLSNRLQAIRSELDKPDEKNK